MDPFDYLRYLLALLFVLGRVSAAGLNAASALHVEAVERRGAPDS